MLVRLWTTRRPSTPLGLQTIYFQLQRPTSRDNRTKDHDIEDPWPSFFGRSADEVMGIANLHSQRRDRRVRMPGHLEVRQRLILGEEVVKSHGRLPKIAPTIENNQRTAKGIFCEFTDRRGSPELHPPIKEGLRFLDSAVAVATTLDAGPLRFDDIILFYLPSLAYKIEVAAPAGEPEHPARFFQTRVGTIRS